jgi:hypothetical protein
MHYIAAQELVQARAVGALVRDRPWRTHALDQGRLGFLGEQQSAQAAGRVDQCGADSVDAVEPNGAARRVGGAARRRGLMVAANLLRRALLRRVRLGTRRVPGGVAAGAVVALALARLGVAGLPRRRLALTGLRVWRLA